MNKRYITLCNSEKYLKGTLTLYESLNATKTSIPLVVFCPKKTPERVRELLKEYARLCGNNCCKLEILESEKDVTLPEEITKGNRWLRWNGTFDKLLIFGLSQYDKLVFIDSDMLILRNLDHLFEAPHLSACCDGHYDPHNLNSGLMVIDPTNDPAEMDRILGHLEEVVHHQEFGDQDIIRLAFREWKTDRTRHLPQEYNLFFESVAQKRKEQGYGLSDSDAVPIYVIHFIGYDKPWYRGKKLKWKVYQTVWKVKMCFGGFKTYHHLFTARILKIYNCHLRTATRKLGKLNAKIYEMD